MRARWKGEEGVGQKTLRLFGLVFTRGQWVSIDGNPMAKQKLPGNPYFETDNGEAPPASEPKPVTVMGAPKNRGGRPRKNPLPETAAAEAVVEDIEGADDQVEDADFTDLDP